MKTFTEFLRESKTMTLVDVITVNEYKTMKDVPEKYSNVQLVIAGVTDTKTLTSLTPKFGSAHYEPINDDGEFTRKVIPGPAKKSFNKLMNHWASYGTAVLIVSETIEKGNAIVEYLSKMNFYQVKQQSLLTNLH